MPGASMLTGCLPVQGGRVFRSDRPGSRALAVRPETGRSDREPKPDRVSHSWRLERNFVHAGRLRADLELRGLPLGLCSDSAADRTGEGRDTAIPAARRTAHDCRPVAFLEIAFALSRASAEIADSFASEHTPSLAQDAGGFELNLKPKLAAVALELQLVTSDLDGVERLRQPHRAGGRFTRHTGLMTRIAASPIG